MNNNNNGNRGSKKILFVIILTVFSLGSLKVNFYSKESQKMGLMQ